MIDKTRIIDAVCERMKTLPISHCLDLRTYKRNRSVAITKLGEDDLLILENGFFKEIFQIKREKLRKLLKILLKKEFPRSRKIRLYVLDRCPEDEALGTKRKILWVKTTGQGTQYKKTCKKNGTTRNTHRLGHNDTQCVYISRSQHIVSIDNKLSLKIIIPA